MCHSFPNKSVLPVFAWLVTSSILRYIPDVSMFKIDVGPLKSPGGDTTLYIFEPTLEPLIPKTNKQRKGSKIMKHNKDKYVYT